MTSVLVVEDDAATRAALVDLLGHLGYEPVSAESLVEALDVLATTHPALVVLDLGLPDTDGVEGVRAVRAACQAPILVLSGSRRRRRQADALDAGADDYLDKPFDVSELRARLRASERRASAAGAAPTALRRFADLEVDLQGRRLTKSGDEVRLTEIEWQVLTALTAEPGRVVTHRRLARGIWGAQAGAEVQSTLRVHIASVRRKLGDTARSARYIRAEAGVGYRWVAAPARDQEASALRDRVLQLRDELARRASVSDLPADREALGLADALLETLGPGADS